MHGCDMPLANLPQVSQGLVCFDTRSLGGSLAPRAAPPPLWFCAVPGELSCFQCTRGVNCRLVIFVILQRATNIIKILIFIFMILSMQTC